MNKFKKTTLVIDGKSRQQRFEEFIEYVEKLDKEKQDLIKYLEDKIKEIKEFINNYEYRVGNIDKEEYMNYVEIYQEILDKIKEGNYE